MAFFEDVAFLVNSGALNKEVAYYMFGYDAKTAWRDDVFWDERYRQHPSWYLLRQFVEGAEAYFHGLKARDQSEGMKAVCRLSL